MERKVIKQGPDTLMVSLPKKWTKEVGIAKGDSVHLAQHLDKLIISKGEITVEKKCASIKILSSYKSTQIRGIIASLYKQGFDKITATIEHESLAPIVQDIVNSLLGYEIVDQTANTITIENVASDLDDKFDEYQRKSFFLIKEMFTIILEDLRQNNYSRKKQITQFNQSVKKFSEVCKRSIINGNIHPEKNKFTYLILWTVEKVSNECGYLYAAAEKYGKTNDKQILSYISEVSSYFNTLYEQYYNIKPVNVETLAKTKEELYFTTGYELLQKTKSPIVVMHALNIVRHVANMINPLIALTYQQEETK